MKTFLLWLQSGLTAFGAFIGWYLGGVDSFLYALIVFVCVDYATGFMCATADRALSYKIGARGIFHKVAIFMLVGVAHMVDAYVIGHDSVLRTAVIFFYLTNEGISLLENAAHLGVPIPPRLKSALAGLYGEKFKDKEIREMKADVKEVKAEVEEVKANVSDVKAQVDEIDSGEGKL